MASSKDEIAKIFVFGEKKSRFSRRKCNNVGIAKACGSLSDIDHVVPGIA